MEQPTTAITLSRFLIGALIFTISAPLAHTHSLGVSVHQSDGIGSPSSPCISNPSNVSCVDFQLSKTESLAEVNALCDQMYMSVCTIRDICASMSSSDNFCQPFSLYKEGCIDMPKMDNCSIYTSMCANGSVISQCNTSVLPIPTTMDVTELVNSICNSMPMAGCTACTSDPGHCDYLTVYSNLCLQMPNMYQCAAWVSMCGADAIANWSLCSASSGGLPEMRMYFHWSIEDFILFYDWVPRNILGYTLSVIGIFLFGILHEGLKAGRMVLEDKWNKDISIEAMKNAHCHDDKEALLSPTTRHSGGFERQAKYPAFKLSRDGTRAILRTLETLSHYLLMLIGMTFNVGLFAAVILGAGAGTLIFGRFSQKAECH
eukprot:TRINITY_DN645_c0_g1_i4.p1 TRINITY_DN645_c0_g1~~TRINITY_DN645_c0_g1_i4.p1  ORF type:complete len:374 (+),score=36.91 TRINITY_DN645_c0_g1_i4:132-1253(+)